MNSILNPLLVALFRIPWVKEHWGKKFNTLESTTIPWTLPPKPISECKIALLTTGGVHLQEEKPFDMQDKDGDPSYRKIPSTADASELMITHDYYDHRDADQDINLVLPIEILKILQKKQEVGESSEFFYSFMGHIAGKHLTTLVEQTSKEVAHSLKQDNVDIAFLVPAWGMCNQTVGLVQREIEFQGIATVGISIVRAITESVKPPRTYFVKYPFGHAMGETFNQKQQITLFRESLRLLESSQEPGIIVDSPYRWRRHQWGGVS